MKTVKGRYDGSVVVLQEPAPLDHPVEVNVEFPDGADEPQEGEGEGSWQILFPGGAPVYIPSPDEARARLDRYLEMARGWAEEDPEYNRQAWAELKEALNRNRIEGGERPLFKDQ